MHVTQGDVHTQWDVSMWRGKGVAIEADLADLADISLAVAAPLTFSWCQINPDLATCHIRLGARLQTRDVPAR